MSSDAQLVPPSEAAESLVGLLALELSRRGPSALAARNDTEAVAAWLDNRAKRSEATRRAYARVAHTFLLWMHEQGIASLASLRVEDGAAYLRHLQSPPAHWIRTSPKPGKDEVLLSTMVLMGPLSARSVAWHRTVLVQMLGYLADSGYLARNVMHLTAHPRVVEDLVDLKSFSLEDWGWLAAWLGRLEPTPTNVRQRWVLEFLYHTGLRREEAAAARFSDLVRKNLGWALQVVGKGGKRRLVTLDSALMSAMRTYRVAIGLPEFPTASEDGPIIERLRRPASGGARNMTPGQIGAIVQAVLATAASDCTDLYTRARLQSASTHTMRHTNVSHRLAAGARLETTQDEVGHASIVTTRLYVHTAEVQRREDAELLNTLYR